MDGQRKGLGHTLSHCCAGRLRYVTPYAAPLYEKASNAAFDQNLWPGVCGELTRRAKLLAEPILRADEKPPVDRPPPSRAWVCAGLVVGRGADATQMEESRFARDDVKVPNGAPGLKFGTSQNACRTAPRSCYFLANSSSVLPILRHVESRCSAMLEYRAYVHHYERYGTTAQDLGGGAGVAARADRGLRRPRSRAGAARRGDGVFDAAAAAAALVFFALSVWA